MRIYTIGHSNHSWEEFEALLKGRQIRVLVDVRSKPASRWAPFANKRTLSALLERAGIGYVYMGDSLGGKLADPARYDSSGNPNYRSIRATKLFRQGVSELIKLAEDSTVAIMCAEENPSKCHRRLLLGPALENRGVTMLHIRKDGTVQGSGRVGAKKVYEKQIQRALDLAEADGASPVTIN